MMQYNPVTQVGNVSHWTWYYQQMIVNTVTNCVYIWPILGGFCCVKQELLQPRTWFCFVSMSLKLTSITVERSRQEVVGWTFRSWCCYVANEVGHTKTRNIHRIVTLPIASPQISVIISHTQTDGWHECVKYDISVQFYWMSSQEMV